MLKATGLLTALVVVSAYGALARLPARSEFRLRKYWGAKKSILAIKQVGDSVFIQSIGPPSPDLAPNGLTPLWRRPIPVTRDGERDVTSTPNGNESSLKEGIIPHREFRVFWDSLERLGFWRLDNGYRALASRGDEAGGEVSVSFETGDHHATTKTVRFFAPESCPSEFRQVYVLLENMAPFAQFTPGWMDLLRYETKEPIEGFKDWYHAEALRAIAAARDSQGLDTLLSMLVRNDDYGPAILRALANIGSKRAIPALETFLALQEISAHACVTANTETLALAAAKVLAAIDGGQSAPAIRRYLDASNDRSHISDWYGLLARAGDHSLIPEVLQILSDPSRHRREYVSEAADALEKAGYRSRPVISALFETAETELKRDAPDDGIVAPVASALRGLTGQQFSFRPEDPLSVKRSNLARWLAWWTANATRFPAGEESGLIQVNSTPSGAAIFLDGTNTGRVTPFLFFNVRAGQHNLRLAMDGHMDWSSSVNVKQERATTVAPNLTNSFGSLRVFAAPGGRISLDGSDSARNAPWLFGSIATGKHRLGLSISNKYQDWDSSVVIARGETTTVRVTLKRAPESLWVSFAKPQSTGFAVWKGPERAVRFRTHTNFFGCYNRVAKVSAVFYALKAHPWPDSSFRFRIYRGDGRTLVYESPVLKAIPGEPGPQVIHVLSRPIWAYPGQFYVSVAPIDTSGQPPSSAVNRLTLSRVPVGNSGDTSSIHSYSGSPGRWSRLEEGELSISVQFRQ